MKIDAAMMGVEKIVEETIEVGVTFVRAVAVAAVAAAAAVAAVVAVVVAAVVVVVAAVVAVVVAEIEETQNHTQFRHTKQQQPQRNLLAQQQR